MSSPCKLCTHKDRSKADKMIVAGATDRKIAQLYGIDPTSVFRHRKHVAELIVAARARRDEKEGDFLVEFNRKQMEHAAMLWDACHEYLLDPDRPGKYDIGPRAEDISVIYDEYVETETDSEDDDEVRPRKIRRKKLLSDLLLAVPNIFNVTYKIADPRKLVLDAIERLESLIKTEAQLMGRLKPEGAASIHLHQEVNFYSAMPVIFNVLKRHPAVLKEVDNAVFKLEKK